MNKSLIFRLGIALIVPLALRAQVIGLSIPDTTGVRGTVVDIPVRADSTLTGANVTSIQLEIRYTPSVLAFDSVNPQGTMMQAAGFIVSANRVESNVIRIAAAGRTPLTGQGSLIYLRFHIIQSGYSELTFTDTTHNYLNQHYPPVSLDNGYLSASEPPNLGLYPDEGMLAVGEQLQFHVTSGTAPYSWSVTNPAVASIDATGLLTALARGFTRIVVHDWQGVTDSTSSLFEVRALRIEIRDTSVYVGHTLDLPVRSSNVNGLNILSGKLTLSFNGDVVTPVGVICTGTLLSGYEPPVVNTTVKGKISIAFAGNVPLTGSGVLLYIRFVTSSTSGWTSVAFSNVVFNENLPAKTVDASINAQALTPLYLNQTNAKFVVGDTLRFSVSNGTAPFSWSTTDTNVARIDQFGLVTAYARGSFKVEVRDALGAVGTTDEMPVFDMFVDIGEHQVALGGMVDVPLVVRRIPAGTSVSALHMILSYDTSVVRPTGVVSAGTLTDGWAYSENISGTTMNVAAAVSTGFQTIGTLVKVRFQCSQTTSVGNTSGMHFQMLVFNEQTPTVLTEDGLLRVVAIPLAPNLISPYDGATGLADVVTLTWSAPTYAEHYRVQVSTDTGFTQLVVNDSTTTSASLQIGPLAANTYYWRVLAASAAGESPWSLRWSFSVAEIPAAPGTPSLVSPADDTVHPVGLVTFVWTASTNAVHYHLVVTTDTSFTGPVFNDSTIAVTSCEVGPLSVGTYYWRVRAKNAGGTSDWSSRRKLTIIDTTTALPAIPILVSPADGTVFTGIIAPLQWTSVNGGTAYHVQVATDTNFTQPVVIDSVVTSTSLDVGPLLGPLGQCQYYWHVSAVNTAGSSNFSVRWSFTISPCGVGDLGRNVPHAYALEQNYPNPFNPSTLIRYAIPKRSAVVVEVFDILGHRIARLVEGVVEPGFCQTEWHAVAPTGIYFCRIEAVPLDNGGKRFVDVKKMVLLK